MACMNRRVHRARACIPVRVADRRATLSRGSMTAFTDVSAARSVGIIVSVIVSRSSASLGRAQVLVG